MKRHDPIAAQQAIIEEFNLFPDWLERYQYLIDLGRKLEPLAASERIDEHLLAGCQSRVWLLFDGGPEAVGIRANSDAAIVSGLIALLIRVYSGASAADIVNTEPFFVEQLGLGQHLSPTRANGLRAMLDAIKGQARQHLAHQH